MKKFLGLIVLLVALAVCAAALVACDPGSGNQAQGRRGPFDFLGPRRIPVRHRL